MDTTLTSPSSDLPWWRPVLRPLITGAGWRGLTHNLLGLVLGTAWFTWIVTGWSLGFGLAITLIGIPILTLMLASVRPLLHVERAAANGLLDAEIPPLELGSGGEGVLGRSKSTWRDATNWRGTLYLLLRFPIGVATFSIAVSTYAAALGLLAAPVLEAAGAVGDWGDWRPDTWYEWASFVPAGLVALLASAWLSEGMAAISRALARWAIP